MNYKEQIKLLTEELNKASKIYYEENNQIMTDKEYDEKLAKLEQLETKYKYSLANTPTKKIGQTLKEAFTKIEHKYPMLSLDKTKDIGKLKEFAEDKEVILSYKLDGLTIVLDYNQGKLESITTRGNGLVGEDVTFNKSVFRDIPDQLKGSLVGKTVTVRGEAILSKQAFKELNKNNDYKNPRNVASGIIRNLEVKQEYKNTLDFVSYELLGLNTKTFEENLELLKENFNVVTYKKTNAKEIEAVEQEFTNNVENYAYVCDGLVVRYNDLTYKNESTSKFPKHSIAFKWQDLEYETTYKETQWYVSRTGQITPVAVFEPVEIDGTQVEKASLHNLTIFENTKLGKGDTVTVYKANMIIPQIAENLTKTGTEKIPEKCPICGGKVEIKYGNDEVKTLYCVNTDCPKKHIGKFEQLCSKQGLDIQGVSEKTIEMLINLGVLKEYKDLYHLQEHKNLIANQEGFGIKSYENLINAIEKSRTTTLSRFLTALGIRLLGSSTAKEIEKTTDSKKAIETILNETNPEILELKLEIGTVVSQEIVEYMKKNKVEIIDLLKELTIKETKPKAKITNTEVLTIAITGKLETITRKQLEEKIEEKGWKNTKAISKNTSYLVNNDLESQSTKNKKAKEFGIPIITEKQILEILDKE